MPEASEPTTPIKRLIVPALGLLLMGTAAVYAARPGAGFEMAHAATLQAPPAKAPAREYFVKRHGGIPLEDLRNAEDRLDAAAVENSHGDPVGAVRNVVVGRGGRPRLVNVAFGGFWGIGGETVPLKADTLGYDPKHNVILTDMTVKELAVIARQRQTQEN